MKEFNTKGIQKIRNLLIVNIKEDNKEKNKVEIKIYKQTDNEGNNKERFRF